MSISQLLPLAAGTFIKDYEIIELLGSGGFGAVYKAKPRNGSFVAIKETHYRNEQWLKMFSDEGELLRSITDEDFPKVIEHFDNENGRYYLIMELIEGDDLLDVLEKTKKPIDLRKVLDWADKILESLMSLHSKNIVHRDIKPQNLKLTPKGRIKIIDLGIAKGYFTENTKINYVGSVGAATPCYAPIEQHLRLDENFVLGLMMCSEEKTRKVLNQGTDARADIYALGVTLYHLLTNTVPTISPNRALSVWSGKGDLVIPAHKVNKKIPLEISQVLQKAMEIERENRFVSVTEMREVLNKAIGAVIYKYEQQKIEEQAKREKDLAERERKLSEKEAKLIKTEPDGTRLLQKRDWREIEAERLQREQEEAKRRQKQIDDIQRELRELKAKPKPSGAKWLVGIISAIILFIGGLLGLNLWVKVTAPQVANTSSNKVNAISTANALNNLATNAVNNVANKPVNSTVNTATNPVTNAESYFTKGYNCKNDDYNCQILNYTTATNLKEDYAEAYAGLGYAYYKQEKYDKAIKNYNKAIKLKEDFTNAYNELGDVYFDTEKYVLAIKNYDKALSLKPDWDFALWNRGHAYWALEKRNEAIKDFRKALEINPDYQQAKDSLKSVLAEKAKK